MMTDKPWLNSYPAGIPAEINLSEYRSIVDVFEQACERYRDQEAPTGWLAPLLAAAASLVVGLLGFNLLTGASLSDVLVAVNRFAGSAVARVLPLAAKAFKVAALLLHGVSDLAEMFFTAAGAVIRSLGPRNFVLLFGLGGAFVLLALFGARRFLSQGEEP